MINSSLYNSTCNVYRNPSPTRNIKAARDSVGTTPTVHIESLPCRLQALSARERVMSGTVGTEVSHKLYCDVADIVESDTIELGSLKFQVVYINNPNLMNHHLEIEVKELKK